MIEKGVLPQSKMFFHMPSEFAKKALFHLIYSGFFYCTKEYIVERDNWNSYLFIYVRKGSMKIQYDHKEYIAAENSFVFLNCNKPHLYQAEEDTIFDWLHFSGNASEDYFDYLFHNSGCVYSIYNNFVITDCMSSILDMAEKDNVDEDDASIMIHKILYELKQLSKHAEETHINSIRSAIKYLESHYQDQITLTDLAKCANLSPFHFSRVFKKHMNCSPYQYLISYRINNAKKLLHNTNLSVQEISFACGFNSVPHFIKIFKQHTNVSPKKFRDLQF
ncbi:AraC family transcriptional regulator [Niallia endozanthoxylica]|uniref:AraC family transcriptional regulator n=1 Tax=Niallia endozanthoxylica TaxID=2036016 RepID=A0A5J5H8T1_9BACI|nr:AraC family transcriptional regulator [Niallia endozanthoxylica]KAA9016980.1 AraC family transcriptional regulator [Niallia endozanthoxylica]